jgi:TRAP-type C4-dicarboxylate transport system permease small subunit
MENPVSPAAAPAKKKTGAIIATVVSSLICGCTAIIACVFGFLGVFQVPIDTTVNGYTSTAPMPSWLGFALLCLSLIFIAVPVIIGLVTLRKKKQPAVTELPPSEPLPPAA